MYSVTELKKNIQSILLIRCFELENYKIGDVILYNGSHIATYYKVE